MYLNGCDIVLRHSGTAGWLGILKHPSGEELYRTGTHHPTPEVAMQKVKEWAAEQPEDTP